MFTVTSWLYSTFSQEQKRITKTIENAIVFEFGKLKVGISTKMNVFTRVLSEK